MTFMKRENINLGFHLSKTWQILMHFARALHQAYTSVFLKSDVCVFSTTLKIGATFNRMVTKKQIIFSKSKNWEWPRINLQLKKHNSTSKD